MLSFPASCSFNRPFVCQSFLALFGGDALLCTNCKQASKASECKQPREWCLGRSRKTAQHILRFGALEDLGPGSVACLLNSASSVHDTTSRCTCVQNAVRGRFSRRRSRQCPASLQAGPAEDVAAVDDAHSFIRSFISSFIPSFAHASMMLDGAREALARGAGASGAVESIALRKAIEERLPSGRDPPRPRSGWPRQQQFIRRRHGSGPSGPPSSCSQDGCHQRCVGRIAIHSLARSRSNGGSKSTAGMTSSRAWSCRS